MGQPSYGEWMPFVVRPGGVGSDPTVSPTPTQSESSSFWLSRSFISSMNIYGSPIRCQARKHG